MSSGLDPSGPPQPPKSEAYTEALNPATRNPSERAAAHHEGHRPEETQAVRQSDYESRQQGGVPSALGRGVHENGPVDKREARNTQFSDDSTGAQRPENPNVDADQMATLSEGKVADAVERKSGTQKVPGQEPHFDDFASDIDRKKAEQASAREAVQEERRAGITPEGDTQRRSGVEVD